MDVSVVKKQTEKLYAYAFIWQSSFAKTLQLSIKTKLQNNHKFFGLRRDFSGSTKLIMLPDSF